jgi:hypothetical protein
MQDREPDYSAPDGAVCAEHAERPAAFTCPRCGNYACLFCWHALSQRCDACLQRDPAAAAPPIGWELPQTGLPGRYVSTLAGAFRPVRSAPAFAQPEIRSALRFFLLSALPFAALAGVIPHTKTMMFGGSLSITLQGKPTPGEIALDIVTAMAIQVGLFTLELAALALPYISLIRAYAEEARRPAAVRVLLYRSWLVPAATLLLYVGLWLLPASDPNTPTPLLPLLLTIQLLFYALLLVSMRACARLACGIGPMLSFTVTVIPFVIWMFVQLFLSRLSTMPMG